MISIERFIHEDEGRRFERLFEERQRGGSIIEVDSDGNVHPEGGAKTHQGQRTSILNDPRGEYTEDPLDISNLFDGQQNGEVMLEVDSDGTVHPAGAIPQSPGQKPSILNDPRGEYSNNRIGVSESLLVLGHDLNRPRMAVEQEKIKEHFPQFRFFAKKNSRNIIGTVGKLKTNYKNVYGVRIYFPEDFPFAAPRVVLPKSNISSNCPHYFSGSKALCLWNDWTSKFSLAYTISKTALWLNKYEIWKTEGKWPGSQDG